jgi:3-deoxy-D-manno-octulosonic-acid transferase
MVESELWPNTLRALDQRAIPRLLLNARLSPRSLARWAARPHLARAILGGFAAIVAQSPDTFNSLTSLGINHDRLSLGGNLKAGASAPPHDPATLAQLQSTLGPRPRWAAVSTHDGEEAAALQAHQQVLRTLPDACLILCPRHPDRAAQIAALVQAHGLTLTRRSTGDGPSAQVYLTDTLGETGLWFRLAPVTFLGGSLTPQGGHNPWEPAACGSALLTGPHLANIAPDMEKLTTVNFPTVLPDAAALGPAVLDLLKNPARAVAIGAAGQAAQAQASGSLDQATALVLALIR